MDISEVYKRKVALQKRIFNMIKKFEDDCKVYVYNISFVNTEVKLGEMTDEYNEIHIDTELHNDIEKIKNQDT